jgi:hypothetical protein
MIIFSDRSIVPHFQPGNQPIEKVGDIFSGRARWLAFRRPLLNGIFRRE